jgi:hypothetical protein
MSQNYLNREVYDLISSGEKYVPIWMFSMTPGLTEMLIKMILEIFPKLPSDKTWYDVEGKRDGS